MTLLANAQAGPYLVSVEGDPGPFAVSLAAREASDGLFYVRLRLLAGSPARPGRLRIVWAHPMVMTHQKWFPGCRSDRTILPEWSSRRVCRSRNTSDAPVYSLFSADGRNALTFALSDAMAAVQLAAGVVEETAEARCEITLFAEPGAPLASYEATLRLDARPVPWHEALASVADWWATLPGMEPAPVPEHARLPMYSSWYSFHQAVDPAGLERQCRLAKPLGMDSVIVDDGWQTDDNSRGYAFCGDWEVADRKLPDFAGHVKRVHDIGMKYILWFSVPFVGARSKVYSRFKDKVLNPSSPEPWYVLDPRFPDVREYLTDLYESFVTRYGIDGFKLDFVDTFAPTDETRDAFGDGRDFDSVPEAVDALLTGVMQRLRRLDPEVLIEFRQSYIGPLMRKYGNMFRAGDVPDDFPGNRLHTTDVRLLSGSTPAHSDMVMWHPNDPVQSAAMQLVHALFSVPQVSVALDRVPQTHVKMLRAYLAFWRDNRDVILDGAFEPREPGFLYPSIVARTAHKLIAASYASGVVKLRGPLPGKVLLVNGTFDGHVVVELDRDAGARRLTVTDPLGTHVLGESKRLAPGLHAIPVPPAGVAALEV